MLLVTRNLIGKSQSLLVAEEKHNLLVHQQQPPAWSTQSDTTIQFIPYSSMGNSNDNYDVLQSVCILFEVSEIASITMCARRKGYCIVSITIHVTFDNERPNH